MSQWSCSWWNHDDQGRQSQWCSTLLSQISTGQYRWWSHAPALLLACPTPMHTWRNLCPSVCTENEKCVEVRYINCTTVSRSLTQSWELPLLKLCLLYLTPDWLSMKISQVWLIIGAHLLCFLLELFDRSFVDTAALVDEMAGGGRLSRVNVANNHDVDVNLLLRHGCYCLGLETIRKWCIPNDRIFDTCHQPKRKKTHHFVILTVN